MKVIIKIFFLCQLSLPVLAQVGSEISVEPIIGMVMYDQDLPYGESVSYGLAVHTSVIGNLNAGISYKTSAASQDITIPGSSLSMTTHLYLYQVHLTYNLIDLAQVFYLAPTIGLGAVRFSAPAMPVDLGALGTASIPERSSTHFVSSPGIKMRLHIFDRLSLLAVPGILLFSDSGGQHMNYYVEGGVHIAIN